MSAPLLTVRDLAYRYPASADGEPGLEVGLAHLVLEPGALLALVGPSGSGKSTLLDMLGLVLPPSRVGQFALAHAALGGGDGAQDLAPRLRSGDLDALAPVRAAALGYVLQQGGLLPFFTVRENIALATGRGADGAVAALAHELGIDGLLDRLPATLSIGQRQRVSLARALHARPALLLADEPTAALDPPTAAEVMDLLVATARRRGTAVVMANHDWALVQAKGFTPLAAETERSAAGSARSTFALRVAA
ncbi:MAG: ATP-binding cassette domain-containing protein [Pseudomonadota bacterium]